MQLHERMHISYNFYIIYPCLLLLLNRTISRFVCLLMFVHLCEFKYSACIQDPEGQKRTSESLELELQVSVNCPTRVLGTK